MLLMEKKNGLPQVEVKREAQDRAEDHPKKARETLGHLAKNRTKRVKQKTARTTTPPQDEQEVVEAADQDKEEIMWTSKTGLRLLRLI